MASPLRWFRKHSFFFIVVFGVFLMAIFGLGSVITGLNPSSMARQAKEENKTVAEWSGGEIKKFDLASLRQRHFASLRFLQNVYKYATEQNGGNTFPVAVEEIMPIVRAGENPSVEQMDERILNRYLFAKRAEQEGFIVNEEMVYEYIAQYGGDTLLNKNLLKQLNRQVNQNLPLTAIVRHLQTELLWQQMESMTRGGIPFDSNRIAITAIAPTEAMELYARTAKKMECVVLPYKVDIDAVTDEPSESEMKKLYQEGKYDYPMYNYESPGFKELKKTKIQYFMADMKTFLDNEIAKLTEEEVEAEYKRLVEAEDRSVMQMVPVEEDENKKEETGDTDSENGESDPAPAPGTESSTESDGGDSKEESTDEDSDDENESPVDEDNTESSDESSEEESEGEEGGYTSIRVQDEEPSSDESEQATNQESDPAPESETPAESESDTQSEESGEDQGSEAENADGGEQAGQETAGEDEATGKDQADGQENAGGDETAGTDETDPVIADDPKTKLVAKPLTEVAEVIKRQLKIEDARKARDAALENAEKAVTFYQRDLSTYEMNVTAGKEDVTEPEAPNFQEIANKNGLQFFETELIDETQVGDEEIGKVVDISIGPGGQAMQINIGDQIFQQFESLPEYQVMVANDFMKNAKYLYWLSEKVDQRVPSYDEAKEAIVKYWKWNKAIELASEKAQARVDEINNGNNVLLNEIAPEDSKLTGQFTWFSSFGRFAYGTPEGVTDPGEDFMSTAFELERNKADMALNETRDAVYVIQNIAPVETSFDELVDEYLAKNFFMTKQVPREVVSAKGLYRQRMNYEWLKQFRETMDVKVVGQ